MRNGKMRNPGDVILTTIQFVDTNELKKRPAVILYEELGNIVVAGITSNNNMTGIKLSKEDGAIKESVIKLNYIFTISPNMIEKTLFSLSATKKKEIYNQLNKNLQKLL